MKEFDFGGLVESNDEGGYNKDPKEKSKIFKLVIIVVVSLVAGLSVYFITDVLINGNKKDPGPVVVQDTDMNVNDEMIVYLYNNVTYSVNGLRNDKFFKSAKVVANDFTTPEKIYYALRYATEADFLDMSTGDESLGNSDKFVVYGISNDKIKESVFNFFGEEVTYTTNTPVDIAVNFIKNGYNAGSLKYDGNSDYWLVTFDKVSDGGPDMVVNPYLYNIESAIKEGKTSNIVIKEKVVFTSLEQYKDDAGNPIDKYDLGIYKDFSKTNQIEMKTGITKQEISLIGIENYKDSAATITYTFFKDENDEYHFLSSEIVSE